MYGRSMSTETTTHDEKIQAVMDLLNTPTEPLHPDLLEYRFETDFFGPWVKHPFVYSPIFGEREHARLNALYEYKKTAYLEALAAKKWHTAVFLHERPWRLNAFLDIAEHLDDQEYWQLLSTIWTDSENIWQNRDEWREAFEADRADRHLIMSDEERDALAALPDTIPVYRGYQHDTAEDGMSWTVDEDRAKWFANRWNTPESEAWPRIAQGQVGKDKIIAYITSRGESEIIVFPEDVTNWLIRDA